MSKQKLNNNININLFYLIDNFIKLVLDSNKFNIIC